MVSLERARELLRDASLTDQEVKEARDVLRLLAEVIFDKWHSQRHAKQTDQGRRSNTNTSHKQ